MLTKINAIASADSSELGSTGGDSALERSPSSPFAQSETDWLAINGPHSGGGTNSLFEHASVQREIAEKFISEYFAKSYAARVDAFMPRLFTPNGRLRRTDIYSAYSARIDARYSSL